MLDRRSSTERERFIMAPATERISLNYFHRRVVVVVAIVVSSAVALLGVLAWSATGDVRVYPDRDRAEQIVRFFMDGNDSLLAYEILDGIPYVVFTQESSGRVIIDRLERRWLVRPPQWLSSGDWHWTRYTDAPASIGFRSCDVSTCETTATLLYGQINSQDITSLEVKIDGEWRRYKVARPGYVIRWEGVSGAPVDYRWLATDGREVWTRQQDLAYRPSPASIDSESGENLPERHLRPADSQGRR